MKQFLMMLGLLLCAQWGMSQAANPKWYARADMYHQMWVGDFSFGQLGVFDKVWIRPGGRVGIEHEWVGNHRARFYQDVMAGIYSNTYEERVFTVGTTLGTELRLWKQLRVAKTFGIHYNLAKPVDVRYRYDGEQWVKAPNTDPAISRWQFIWGGNLGWRFLAESSHPLDLFFKANISLQGPWQPHAGIPFLFAKSAGIGLRVGL